MAEKITMKDMLANLPQKTDVDTVVGRDASGNPVYIKKSDLAQVVAELMPLATYRKSGLMSSGDKEKGINYLYVQGGDFIKICGSNILWQRAGGCIFFSQGNDLAMFCFTTQLTTKGYEKYICCLTPTIRKQEYKFYYKEGAIYVFFNVPAGTWTNVWCFSNIGIEYLKGYIPDESYTEIPLDS